MILLFSAQPERSIKKHLEVERINFLGMIINKGEIELQNHVLEKIDLFPCHLQDKLQVQRLLGCINYIRSFIPRIAQIAQTLQNKVKKDYKWSFTEEDALIVRKIQSQCKNLPKLELPKEEDNVILETDASDSHWAGERKN